MKQFYIQLLAISFFLPTMSLAQNFTDVSYDAGIDFLVDHEQFMGGGTAFFDYNNDGFADIYVTGGEDRDRLYQNNGDGTFTEKGMDAGLIHTADVMSHSVATGDIDNDGFRDVFIGTRGFNFSNSSNAHCLLYYNNGDGTFTDISVTAGILDSAWTAGATFGDFNLDGYLDIYATNYVEEVGFISDTITNQLIGFAHNCYPDFLYMNNGDNTFTQVASEEGLLTEGCGLAAAATDYDNDCDLDILVANDFGEWVHPNVLIENNYPSGGYTDVSQSSGSDVGIYAMGIAVGDYDEDLDLDYYISNLGRNVLMRNEGDGSFIDVATAAGVENTAVDTLLVTSWGNAFFDYDNDSYLDLYVANGYIPAAQFIATTIGDPNKLYRNNRDGTFTNIADTLGVDDHHVARGMAMGDYDNDGDLDMLVVVVNKFLFEPDYYEHIILYRNDLNNDHNWLKVKLTGVENNRDGFGAHLLLKAGGRTLMREVGGGSSHASQHSSIVHFGLEDIAEIDSLIIRWPGCGTQVITDIPLNQQIEVLEDVPVDITQAIASTEITIDNSPNPFAENTSITYRLPNSSHIQLSLYDGMGRKIAQLIEGNKASGVHQYSFSAKQYQLTSGIYFVVLNVEGKVVGKKVVVGR